MSLVGSRRSVPQICPFRGVRSAAALCGVLALTLIGCSSNPQTSIDSKATLVSLDSNPVPQSVVAAAPESGPPTPNGSVGGSATSRPTGAAPAGQGPPSTFASQLIETPPDLLSVSTPEKLPADATTTPADFSIVATANVPRVDVYATSTDRAVMTTLRNPLPDGRTPLTLLVDAQTPTRAKVLLPVPPNGSTGWVDLSQLQTARNDYRIEVSLAKHQLVVRHGADAIMTESVGVGKAETPTPLGRFYVKALLKPPNQNTVYGHYAYPLSGQSESLKEWQGGEPTLGLHGTNDPAGSIGKDVSHGCIRMRNEAIDTLAKILPLGTPLIVSP